VSVEGNVVEIENIDAITNTPVLDLKPFIPAYDSAPDTSIPDCLGRK